jgi:hypothetical protein
MNRDIDHQLEACYTVSQLMDRLDELDPDARIFFVCNYGDYHRTSQALPVGEVVEADTTDLATTAYSQSGICLVEQDEPDESRPDEDEVFPIAILRS